MKTPMRLFLLAASMLAVAVSPLRAQVVNDGATNTLSNVTNTIPGDVTVGTNGSFTLLILSDNALLTNSANGLIGRNATAKSNTVFLTDVNTRWLVASNLLVGNDGSFNRLVISNGGGVRNNFGRLGANPSSSNNEALVTGPGSSWTNLSEFNVGNFGSGNRLLVNNGGSVRSEQDSYIGLAGNNNEALVTGPDSSWTSLGEFFVGFFGSRNQLVISNGGGVRNSLGGYLGASTTGSNNLALITGSGSVWSNASELYVGFASAGNQLVVSNGATVTANNGVIGNNSSANLNSAILTDPGTRWLLGSNLYVGSNGALSRLVISNGALVRNEFAAIGNGISSSNNEVVVTGAGSIWSNRSSHAVGESGRGNRLVVTNGGRVDSNIGQVGTTASSSNNEAVVTGPGSLWKISNNLGVGISGSGNRLVVSNAGAVQSDGVSIGSLNSGSNNEALVTGAGSSWSNMFSSFRVGSFGSQNRLVVSNAGVVCQFFTFIVGVNASSTNNRVVVDGGTLLAANFLGTGVLDVRRGTNVLNAGLIEVDQLLLTNTQGFFEFNGGTLRARSTTNSNGRVFDVGNGTSAATLQLQGGTHAFANNLVVASNASLVGNGTVIGTLTVQTGGKLSPGVSVGKIVLSNTPVLQGSVLMEISKNVATVTNDQIQVTAPLTFGGLLIVSNLGPTALAAGDNFKLFSANSYTGSFSVVSLPSLPAGLNWTNKLLVDGSIEVVAVAVPKFASISMAGTNVIIAGTNGTPNAPYAVVTSTNVAVPLSNWVSIATNQFDSSGAFSFTNTIAPGEPARFFGIRTP